MKWNEALEGEAVKGLEMSENREAAIKLFGAMIPLEKSQDLRMEETSPKSTDEGHESADSQEKIESTTSTTENNKPSSTDQDDTSASKSEEQQPDTDQSSSKAKKPDKILPCPRCKSQDTKFCYFNNYNVNQPRHFCKNCQRYWTAGGSMRNVPVGAGRRKSKSSSHCRDIAASDSSIQALPNGAVLSFGVNVPICNSVISRPEETSTTPIPCLSNASSPWPYPWAAAPPLCSIPFVPIPQGTWSIQWLSPIIGSCNPTLGKHSRDENMLKNNHLVNDESQKPKTMRIDDNIREAAKSSIWTMLGVKAFKPKLDIKNHVLETSPLMHVNPAALTRHLDFQEAINK